jgi:hypothetical protein
MHRREGSPPPSGAVRCWQGALLGYRLRVGATGELVPTDSLLDKYLLVMFNDHAMRGGTGRHQTAATGALIDWHGRNSARLNVQVVWLPATTQASMTDTVMRHHDEWCRRMVWPCAPLNSVATQRAASLLGVDWRYSLVLIAPTGHIITKRGWDFVLSDPTGSSFPWIPPPVPVLALHSKPLLSPGGSAIHPVEFFSGCHFILLYFTRCTGLTKACSEARGRVMHMLELLQSRFRAAHREGHPTALGVRDPAMVSRLSDGADAGGWSVDSELLDEEVTPGRGGSVEAAPPSFRNPDQATTPGRSGPSQMASLSVRNQGRRPRDSPSRGVMVSSDSIAHLRSGSFASPSAPDRWQSQLRREAAHHAKVGRPASWLAEGSSAQDPMSDASLDEGFVPPMTTDCSPRSPPKDEPDTARDWAAPRTTSAPGARAHPTELVDGGAPVVSLRVLVVPVDAHASAISVSMYSFDTFVESLPKRWAVLPLDEPHRGRALAEAVGLDFASASKGADAAALPRVEIVDSRGQLMRCKPFLSPQATLDAIRDDPSGFPWPSMIPVGNTPVLPTVQSYMN